MGCSQIKVVGHPGRGMVETTQCPLFVLNEGEDDVF